MSSYSMLGLIFWLLGVAVEGYIKGNYPLAVYGLAGAVINASVLWMQK